MNQQVRNDIFEPIFVEDSVNHKFYQNYNPKQLFSFVAIPSFTYLFLKLNSK